MAAIVNLNKFRKQRSHAEAERRAAENRALHGRTKIERSQATHERQRADKMLDDSKIESDDGDG